MVAVWKLRLTSWREPISCAGDRSEVLCDDGVLNPSDLWVLWDSSDFFLCVDGVYFLYRRCDFLHAGLCFSCFSFGLCCGFMFAAAMLFSSSPVLALLAFLTESNGVCYPQANKMPAVPSLIFCDFWPVVFVSEAFSSFLPSGECRTLYNQILTMMMMMMMMLLFSIFVDLKAL